MRQAFKEDREDVVRFLCRHFSESTAVFREILSTDWCDDAPNIGFVIEENGQIFGVYAAIYSWRIINGQRRFFLNLAAWAVDKPYRRYSLKLLSALTEQDIDVAFTISASGHAGKVLSRRGFTVFDTGNKNSCYNPSNFKNASNIF